MQIKDYSRKFLITKYNNYNAWRNPIIYILLIKKYQISFKLSSIFERSIFENF